MLSLASLDAVITFSSAYFSLMKLANTPFHFAASDIKAKSICHITNCTHRGSTTQDSVTNNWKGLDSCLS